MTNIDWKNLKVLILDVDGTLYNQSKLRKRMLFQLLKYYLFRPFQIKELSILYHFRLERERNAGYKGSDLESDQYKWCADKLNIPVKNVKEVIDKWIFEFPNPYLSRYSYPGVNRFIELLKKDYIKTAIYSDYKSSDKMKFLNIDPDMIVASTDKNINSLKPNPKGVHYIMNTFGVLNTQCLFIGDRPELDGLCAAAAGIPFINIKSDLYDSQTFYNQLTESFELYKLQNQ